MKGIHSFCPACSRYPLPDPLTSSGRVAELVRPLVAKKKVELFFVLALDVKLRPIGKPIRIAIGCLSATLVHPREVFRPLIQRSAHACIAIHNHPSGVCEPSPEDAALTRRLASAGELLGIRLLDHVVVAKHDWFSFADSGELSTSESR